ncbi:uncharacterized protein [Drosophila suzukii]|uniref:Uncharacterized protein isoform X2 n=1 Tax=Drosophila suzukii TaxID=28584 RepID=A0ABM4TV28_DROSZ
MPSKRHLEKRGRRRRNAVQLNDFLRGDDEQLQETTPSSNQSQFHSNESNGNAHNASSIGTIPLSGLVESDVTPVVTTQQSEDQEKASPPVQQHALKPTINVWLSAVENTQPEANYNVDAEEYPDLGKRSKRCKQPTPPLTNSNDGGVISSPNIAQRLRGRRGRIIDPPVLANFLPEAVLPSVSSNKQQTVAKRVTLVRPGDNDHTLDSTTSKISLLKRDSAQPHERNAGHSPQKERKNLPKTKEHNTPVASLEQQKAIDTTNQQQQKTPNKVQQQQGRGSASPSLKQQKSPTNSIWEQPRSSENAGLQKQKSQGKSSQQQQVSKKPAGYPVQQQQKSPGPSSQRQQQNQQQKSPSKLPQGQQKNPVGPAKQQHQQQKTPGNPLEQQKTPGNPLEQQHKSSGNPLEQQQTKSSVNPLQQQQKTSGIPLHQQQQKTSGNILHQQPTSSGNLLQQQPKSPRDSMQQQPKSPLQQPQQSTGNQIQQQQKSSGNHLQQPQKSTNNHMQQQPTSSGHKLKQQPKSPRNPTQQQPKSPRNPLQQPQKSTGNHMQEQPTTSGNHLHQQPKSGLQQRQKSPAKSLQQQQKGPGSSAQQQHQRSPVRQQQQQQPKSSGNTIRQQPKSPAKTPRDDENVASIPVPVFTDQPIQQQTPFPGSNSAGYEDDDVIPPTPMYQSQRLMSWRFPRSNNNLRLVRSLQSMSQQFMQSSPEESQEDQAVPRQLQTYVQQQMSPQQVKRLPGNQPLRHIRQLAMRSSLNCNAQEFRPREHRVAGGSNQQSQMALGGPGEREEVQRRQRRPSRMSRRRRRQRFLRSLHNNSSHLLPTRTPSVGLLPTPMIQPRCNCSAPPLAPVYHYAPATATQQQTLMQPQTQSLPQPVIQTLPQSIPQSQLQYQPQSQLQLMPQAQVEVQPSGSVPIQVMVPPETIKVNAGSNPPPLIFYNPQSGNIWGHPTPQLPIEIQSRNASQSVFRLASLPCTGVGTPNTDFFTGWSTPSPPHHSPSCLPSSISGPSQLQWSHTLSSPPLVEDQQQLQEEPLDSSIYQDEDLMYTRPLLDMDREDTQSEEGEEEEEYQAYQDLQEWEYGSGCQSESELQASQPPLVDGPHGNPNAVVVEDTGAPFERHQIFRAPSQQGQEYPKPDLNCVPSSIKKLYHLISSQYSDYSFVYALSAQLSQDCVPMDCYVYLKMVLLASIVSIETEEVRAPIALCIIATDSLIANHLMNKVGQLAPRFLGPHDYGLHPTFSALPTRFNWVVACPLLMAQQGVYYVGDWSRLTKDQGCQLEKCIENGAVPVPQLQIDQPLEAAVWTQWQPDNSSNQTQVLSKLCPIFGLPIYMGDHASESLWNLIIHQHSAEGQHTVNDGLNIHEEDMRMLIHLLHQRKTTFSDGAQQMLQKYYVISRKERPTVFSSKTYIVLKQFAESFAKLAFRLEVLESDVCVAIFHCEHFVQRVYGTNEHLAPPAVITFNVIARIDPYMNEFARWLLQYLDRYEDEDLGIQPDKRRRTDSWGMP